MDYKNKAQIIEFILRADHLMIKYAKIDEFIKQTASGSTEDVKQRAQLYSAIQHKKKQRLQKMIADAEMDLFRE